MFSIEAKEVMVTLIDFCDKPAAFETGHWIQTTMKSRQFYQVDLLLGLY